MTIGQVAAGDKESEITAARSLLGLTDLTGTLVTGDALHCQGETARLMKDGGGEWLFTLKANRPAQHAEVRAWFADPANDRDGKHTTTDADNGRIEDRRHAVSHDVSWMLSGRQPPRRGANAGSRHAGHGGTNRDPGRQSHHATPFLFVVRLAERCHFRGGGSRPLADRELSTLGAGRGFRPGPRPKPQGSRAREPHILRKLALNVLRTAHPNISIRRKRKRSGWSDRGIA